MPQLPNTEQQNDIINRIERIEDLLGITNQNRFNEKINKANEYLKTIKLVTYNGDVIKFDYFSRYGFINGFIDNKSYFWDLSGKCKNVSIFSFSSKDDLVETEALRNVREMFN